MNAFEAVTIIVTAVGIALCFTPYFRVDRVLGELGHQGRMWFDHHGDRSIEELPSEDAVDAPIPHRPLRGRF